MDYNTYQMPPQPKPNGFETAAFILGIISIAAAVVCFPFIAPAIGAFGILFAILSKRKSMTFSPKAKKGVILSTVGLVLGIVVSIAVSIFAVVTLAQEYTKDELHDYLNEAYDQYYGESFDDMYESIYGDTLDF